MVDIKASLKLYCHTLNAKIKKIKQNLASFVTAEEENENSLADTGPNSNDLEAGVQEFSFTLDTDIKEIANIGSKDRKWDNEGPTELLFGKETIAPMEDVVQSEIRSA